MKVKWPLNSRATKIFYSAFLPAFFYWLLSPRQSMALYRPLLFHPNPLPESLNSEMLIEVYGRLPEEVWLACGRQRLHGYYFPLPEAEHTVLIHHGNSGNMLDRAKLVRWLLSLNLSVFIYDYRGFGGSSGRTSVKTIVEDGLCAFDFLTGRGIPESSIVLYGESLGVAVSANVASLRKPAALFLQSGFSSLRQVALETFPLLGLYPQKLYPKPTLNSASLLAKGHPPLLIAHGKLDPSVSVSHAYKLYDAASGDKELLIVEEGLHNDLVANHPKLMTAALNRLLARTRSGKDMG